MNATPRESQCLPGTALKKMLEFYGLKDREGCPCRSHAAKMDRWGCDESERRIDEIVTWLEQEAKSRGLPFSRTLGTLVVNRAIRKARKSSNGKRPSLQD
jgi:hypothetical protein